MVAVKKRKPATIQNTNESVRDAPKLSKSKISHYTVKECPSYILQCIYINAVCLVCVFLSQEKDAALSDDYGKDLASVQALQRKHEGFEVCMLYAY